MKNRSEMFGRLLKGAINSIATYEGKTAPIVEEELGDQIRVAGKTIQRYKSGYLPPDDTMVKTLAEAAVQRGFLGREWLQRFLHAARYPFAEQLLDQLCPSAPPRPRLPRICENLPAPTYSQFVMRAQAFAEVIDGLQQRSAVVLIVGLGGNGKTSLAREVAAHCLQPARDGPQFDAVVWVSDKDRPGTTNLSTVLDEIAHTLDYPGFAQFEYAEKQREVEQLLRRQHVLLVVDNFETITDGALLTWLLRLPEPSKAIITSREKHRGLWSSWLVELRGMTEDEAQELIGERARVLKIKQLVSDRTQLEPLVIATGGNPKALTMALGLLKYERRPLRAVVDDLYAARGELFDDLFLRAWALLDEAARRVLLVMPFFPDSASNAVLAATADVQGFAFDRAIERLTDLALLDAQQEDLSNPPRYALHSLVRAFAAARLAENAAFEQGARERWLAWYVQFAEQAGVASYNLDGFARFEPEQETTFAVADWALQHQRYTDALRLSRRVNYYYYVRGIWDKNLALNLIGAEAAHHLDQPHTELLMRAYYVQRLIMQDNMLEAERQLCHLESLRESCDLSADMQHTVQHTFALYDLAHGRLAAAQAIWERDIARAATFTKQTYHIVDRLWLATCLHRRGDLAQARQLARDALTDAVQIEYTRAGIAIRLLLAAIDLDDANLDNAESWLHECHAVSLRYQDRPNIARLQHLLAQLHTARGDIAAARTALAEAIDLFERLGMRRELAQARGALTHLALG